MVVAVHVCDPVFLGNCEPSGRKCPGAADTYNYTANSQSTCSSQQWWPDQGWEGFNTTNYLNTEQYLFTPPTAQVAVGPINITTIVIVSSNIRQSNAIVSNGAGGTKVPQVLAPTSYLPTSEALLDAWLGEAILNNLCPTGRDSNISCLVDNATVRYDQLQGRWIVAMNVTSTGVETLGNVVTKPRKASWVVLISKFSTFPVTGTVGSSDVFIANTPPIGSTGGVNTANWSVYYGNAINGLGTDGFGNVPTANGAVGQGNINSLPGVAPTDTTVEHDSFFDCQPSAIQASGGAEPLKVCYFPTSLRIGIDNDNIILTSAVVNANYYIPAAGNIVPIPAFAGTRVRVLKKGGGNAGTAGGFYQKSLGQLGLTAGDQFNATRRLPLRATTTICMRPSPRRLRWEPPLAHRSWVRMLRSRSLRQ